MAVGLILTAQQAEQALQAAAPTSSPSGARRSSIRTGRCTPRRARRRSAIRAWPQQYGWWLTRRESLLESWECADEDDHGCRRRDGESASPASPAEAAADPERVIPQKARDVVYAASSFRSSAWRARRRSIAARPSSERRG
jgi:hypothetical protein